MERYFRPESKYDDNIYALPIETSNLRLYIIRISENIVILGNGGLKTTNTYNEDKFLNACVELLQEVSRYLNTSFKRSEIAEYQNTLVGNLTFYVKSKPQ